MAPGGAQLGRAQELREPERDAVCTNTPNVVGLDAVGVGGRCESLGTRFAE